MRSLPAVTSSASAMLRCSFSGKALRSPMTRSRTPFSSSRLTSARKALMNSSISRLTSDLGRRQFSLLKANRVSAPTPWRTLSSTTARTLLTPAR